jgi:hypothetical protein
MTSSLPPSIHFHICSPAAYMSSPTVPVAADMSVPNSPVPVASADMPVPGTSIHVSNLPDNGWSFRCIRFYAMQLPADAPVGQRNRWLMKLGEENDHNGDMRFIAFDLTLDSAGRIITVKCRPSDGRQQTKHVVVVQVEATPVFRLDQETKGIYLAKYPHHELMADLRAGFDSELLEGTDKNPLRLFFNIISLLQRKGAVSERTRNQINAVMKTSWRVKINTLLCYS